MQWILQEFEDTRALAEALDRLGYAYSWHKVIPFIGDLTPKPVIADPKNTILFGAYSLWRYAERHHLSPGVFKLSPFVHQKIWHPFLLNGPGATFLKLHDIPQTLPKGDQQWFLRPVSDSKEEPGRVRSADEIHALAQKVLSLAPEDIPDGSLTHHTQLMLTPPAKIQKEWRIWVVGDQVVTYSLYKDGRRVTYRAEIDADALEFVRDMVALNPGYAQAYVIDLARTNIGLKILETNCLNAAGFYAADLLKLATAPQHRFSSQSPG